MEWVGWSEWDGVGGVVWCGVVWWELKTIYLLHFKGLSSEVFGIQTFADGFGVILNAVAEILKYRHTTHTHMIDCNASRMKRTLRSKQVRFI